MRGPEINFVPERQRMLSGCLTMVKTPIYVKSGVKNMKRKMIAIMLLILTMISLCSCESDVEKAQRKLDAASQAAQEARQKANEAREKVEILEAILGK